MSKSALWQISVTIHAEAEEAVAEFFEKIFGTPPSVYIDAATQAVTLSAYCGQAKRQIPDFRAALRSGLQDIRSCGLETGSATLRVQRLRHEDWAESWKRHFAPLEIDRTLLVKPGWSTRRPRAGQAVVLLDPGLSFGTGQHPTTLFCLKQLVRLRPRHEPQSFLDIGTGSGILAIAAARIGYRPVKAIDFDPAAIRVASSNSRRNGLAGRIRITRRDLTRMAIRSREKFDVICANLDADLLLAHRRRIGNRLAAGGALILAGILRAEFKKVLKIYRSEGMKVVTSRAEGEWESVALLKY